MSSPRDKKLNATLAAESPTMTPKSAQVLGLSTPNMTHKTAKMMGVSTDVVAERSKSGTSKSSFILFSVWREICTSTLRNEKFHTEI